MYLMSPQSPDTAGSAMMFSEVGNLGNGGTYWLVEEDKITEN